jgi:hypothetical protein
MLVRALLMADFVLLVRSALCGFYYPFVGAAGFCQSGVCGFTL